jgi:uncharacterized integral membrane protein
MRFLGRLAWSIISLLAIVLAMLFATSNTQSVSLQLWPLNGSLTMPVWMMVLGATAIGALFGGGLVWLSLMAAKTRNWRLQRRLGKAEKRATTAEEQLTTSMPDNSTPTGQQPVLPSRQ